MSPRAQQRRKAPRPLAWAAIAALAVCAPRAAAGEGEDISQPADSAEPAAPDAHASSRPEDRARASPPRDLILRPHVDIGLMAGGPRLGGSFQAGLRIHPVVLVFSAFLAFTDEEYMTFTGAKLGYQRTLSPSWAGYVAAGYGSAAFNGADAVTRRGGAAVLDVGLLVCPERAINALGFGLELLLPNAPAGTVRTLGDPGVVLTFTLNPLLAGGMGRLRLR